MSKSPLTAKHGLKVLDTTDATKAVSFDVSGITAGQTRVLKAPDTDAVLASVQDIQNAAADKPSMSFDGNADSVISAADAKLALGTSDCTCIVRARTTTLAASNINSLTSIVGTLGAAAVAQYPAGTAKLAVLQNSTWYDSGVVLDSTEKPFVFSFKRNGGNVIPYFNGVAKPAIPVTISDITSPATAYIGNTTANCWQGQVFQTLWFNYALSDAKRNYYEAGGKLLAEDVGGAQALLANPGFTGSATSWILSGWVYNSNNVKATGSLTNPFIVQSMAIAASKTCKYRITYEIVSNENNVQLSLGGAGFFSASILANNLNIDSTVGVHTVIVTPDYAGAGTSVSIVYSGTTNFGSTTGLVIDNFNVDKLGCLVAYEPEGIGYSTWVDSSNGLNGAVIGAKGTNLSAKTYAPTSTPQNGSLNDTSYYSCYYSVSNNMCTFQGEKVNCINPAASIFIDVSLPIPADATLGRQYVRFPITVYNGTINQTLGVAILDTSTSTNFVRIYPAISQTVNWQADNTINWELNLTYRI